MKPWGPVDLKLTFCKVSTMPEVSQVAELMTNYQEELDGVGTLSWESSAKCVVVSAALCNAVHVLVFVSLVEDMKELDLALDMALVNNSEVAPIRLESVLQGLETRYWQAPSSE